MSDVEIRGADAIPEADDSEQARLSHRLEAVGQLAAGIAHEINTPLQFVGDSVKFLNEAVEELLTLTGLYRELLWTEVPIGQEQRKQVMTDAEEHADLDYLLERIPAAFNRTMEGLDRVTSIVGAMKSFAHPEGSEAMPTDLNEALETTLTVCRNEYKHVAELQLELGELRLVTCNLGGDQPGTAEPDRQRRPGDRGVGGRHRPPGHEHDHHSARLHEAIIEIADDGPGIPAAIQDRIYDPFFTTKEVGKGTGQGLALARATIERHAGTLNCVSAPGKGTRFTIRLPVEPFRRPPPRRPDPHRSGAPGGVSSGVRPFVPQALGGRNALPVPEGPNVEYLLIS